MDIAEAVAAVEVVGDENLVFQRPVCADRDNRRELLETAVARGKAVFETIFALFFEDVEHGDCVLQTARDGQPVPSLLPLPLPSAPLSSLDVLLEIDIPECQRDQQHLELRVGRGERQQQGEDVVHAVDSRISTSCRVQGSSEGSPRIGIDDDLTRGHFGGNCYFEKRGKFQNVAGVVVMSRFSSTRLPGPTSQLGAFCTIKLGIEESRKKDWTSGRVKVDE